EFRHVMVVSREDRLCGVLRTVVQIFGYRPRDRKTVESRSPSAYLIENYKTALGRRIQYIGRFGHLHHKCRASAGEIVRCSHAGEYAIYKRETRFVGRHERAYLS